MNARPGATNNKRWAYAGMLLAVFLLSSSSALARPPWASTPPGEPPQSQKPPKPDKRAVDLDIVSFTATEAAESTAERRVYVLELGIVNSGKVDQPRDAIIVARTVLGNSRVFGERFPVEAPVNSSQPTVYQFTLEVLNPSGGGLDWTAYLEDDDPDYDSATVRTLYTF